ncbi:hypothetical protein LDENG_00197380 [Lucifuga dentata]|nr:hypothetical protein LDENG_00197380 [Lucifuga dentata]
MIMFFWDEIISFQTASAWRPAEATQTPNCSSHTDTIHILSPLFQGFKCTHPGTPQDPCCDSSPFSRKACRTDTVGQRNRISKFL